MNKERKWLSAIALVLILLAAQSAVFAREPVDPSTLNPPVPPEFNPICEKLGRGTICNVKFTDPPVANEPGGVLCSGNELIFNATRSVVGKRYYDQDGNLIQRHFREDMVGTFVHPLTRASVSFDEGNTIIHNLAVPGDLSTGTESFTGFFRLYVPHGGTVLVDVGRVVQLPDGTIINESGQHPFLDYFVHGDTASMQPSCDALEQ